VGNNDGRHISALVLSCAAAMIAASNSS
jgi:hypothetical protein